MGMCPILPNLNNSAKCHVQQKRRDKNGFCLKVLSKLAPKRHSMQNSKSLVLTSAHGLIAMYLSAETYQADAPAIPTEDKKALLLSTRHDFDNIFDFIHFVPTFNSTFRMVEDRKLYLGAIDSSH